MIFTIGYQALPAAQLRAIAGGLNARVIDCRRKPVSRKRGYSRGALEGLLGEGYEWRGDQLGGGQVSAAGIAALKRDTRSQTLLLLCLEHVPAQCHRHEEICAPHFPDAIHIFEDELILASELAEAIEAEDEYWIAGSLAELLGGLISVGELFD